MGRHWVLVVSLWLSMVIFAFPATGIGDGGPHSCTIFTISMGERVFFGNNEDYSNPETCYWAIPPREGKYGGVFFGFDDVWPQGGVNEMGLAFDINALEETPLHPRPELPDLDDYEGYIVLSRCATVEEAIDLVKEYNWGEAMWGQIHFADATGDAVVVGPGRDGELAFTRKVEGDGFLVSTNFNLAFFDGEEGKGICNRYDRAVDMLGEIESPEDLDVEELRGILDSVHVEGNRINTQYSNIYDLKNGDIYLYYYHQFEESARLNVAEVIARETEPVPIRSLFSEEILKSAEDEFRRYRSREVLTISLFLVLVFILSAGLGVMVRKRVKN